MAARGSAMLGLVLAGVVVLEALAQPPLGQMSGIPLPDAELPDGTITVRVVRGQVTNNVTNQAVELHQGDNVVTALTDGNGRATFSTLSPGSQVRAITELDGQRLESQPFAAPGRGGIRLMLVGADPGAPSLPARSGAVTFGSDSWIQVELVEESVEIYFFLQVMNPAGEPVDPSTPIAFDMPGGAQGTSVLRSSTPRGDSHRSTYRGPGPVCSWIDPGALRVHLALRGGEPGNLSDAARGPGFSASVRREVGLDGFRVQSGAAPYRGST